MPASRHKASIHWSHCEACRTNEASVARSDEFLYWTIYEAGETLKPSGQDAWYEVGSGHDGARAAFICPILIIGVAESLSTLAIGVKTES